MGPEFLTMNSADNMKWAQCQLWDILPIASYGPRILQTEYYR
jgi:hypothetical protein